MTNSNINLVIGRINTAMNMAVALGEKSEEAKNNGYQEAAFAALIAAENDLPATYQKAQVTATNEKLAWLYAVHSNGGDKDKAAIARAVFLSILAPAPADKIDNKNANPQDVNARAKHKARRAMALRGVILASVLDACEVGSKDRDAKGAFMIEPRYFMKKGDKFFSLDVKHGKGMTSLTDEKDVLGKAFPMNGTHTLYVKRTVSRNGESVPTLVGVVMNASNLVDNLRKPGSAANPKSIADSIKLIGAMLADHPTPAPMVSEMLPAIQNAIKWLTLVEQATAIAHSKGQDEAIRKAS